MSQSEKKEYKKKYKSTWLHTTLVLTLVALGGLLIYRAITQKLDSTQRSDKEGCSITLEAHMMGNHYMSGIIEKGESFQVEKGFYQCHPVEVGDVVLFHVSTKLPPVVKIVRAIAGDQLTLIPNPKLNRWTLNINGEPFLFQNQPYYFGSLRSSSQLKKHIEEVGPEVGPQQVLIFSYRPPGIQDSGTFGLVHKKDLIGKVIIEDEGKLDRLANY